MDKDIIAQLSAALVPLLGTVCGYLAGKLRSAAKRAKAADAADKKQQAALVDAVKSLLRGQIIDDGLTYLEEGAIPPFALQSMELQYDAYERLGDGDKSVNDIMQRCKGLKIRSGHQYEKE